MSESSHSIKQGIIDLYTDLAQHADKDFGWEKGKQNAIKHGYKEGWMGIIPDQVWDYCAAVGNPFNLGEFHQGDIVLDIGCGAGVDVCVASLLVGKSGKVYGLDLTPAMVEKTREHARLSNLDNVTVYEGSIEKIPLENDTVNIIISNGAINLSSFKEKVFSEIYRVLASDGALYFADMIKDESQSKEDKENICNSKSTSCNSDSWADCVSGTLKKSEVLQLMKDVGFVDAEHVSTTHYKTASTTIGATFRGFKV